MGMDVLLYAETKVTDEELAAAENFIGKHCPIADNWYGRQEYLRVWGRMEDLEPRIELNTLARYFGPFYPRGYWPDIYVSIRAMQAAFPKAKVFYGGDGADRGSECTEEMLEKFWVAWIEGEYESDWS